MEDNEEKPETIVDIATIIISLLLWFFLSGAFTLFVLFSTSKYEAGFFTMLVNISVGLWWAFPFLYITNQISKSNTIKNLLITDMALWALLSIYIIIKATLPNA